MTKIRYIYQDRCKKWKIVCDSKVISKHITFTHAQEYIPKLFKQNRISNNYKIEPIR